MTGALFIFVALIGIGISYGWFGDQIAANRTTLTCDCGKCVARNIIVVGSSEEAKYLKFQLSNGCEVCRARRLYRRQRKENAK